MTANQGGSSPQLVRLNVGGTLYSTTRETLLREPNTLFSAILEGGTRLEQLAPAVLLLDDSSFFIDRDGLLFSHVLSFLRNGHLVLPDSFRESARLRDEIDFYRIERMNQELAPIYNSRYPNSPRPLNGSPTGLNSNDTGGGGYITLGYRGTFAFGRDGQADVKFRKLHRILVCGKVALCREVFGDTLNESRDPGDMDGAERYTSRLYLKHQWLERACDNMAEKGFKLVATCCSGANGLATSSHQVVSGQLSNSSQNELMNHRNSGDYEEQRWAHYTEYIFYREPQPGITSSGSPTREFTATI